MRLQGFASPCGYGVSGTGFPLQHNAAPGASRQELVHGSSKGVKLYMAPARHTSTSGTRSSRARVRPRSEQAAGAQRRTVLLPVGAAAAGASPSFLETKLASSVMAGDDHMEQLSLVQQRGAAAAPPSAAVWSHGHGTSSGGSLGGEGRRRGKHEHRYNQRAQRGGERGRSGSGVVTAAPATATHEEVKSRPFQLDSVAFPTDKSRDPCTAARVGRFE